jgi:hypothetical protein
LNNLQFKRHSVIFLCALYIAAFFMFFHKDTFCVSLFQDKTLKKKNEATKIAMVYFF